MKGLYRSVISGMIVDFEGECVGTVVDIGNSGMYRVGYRGTSWTPLSGHWIKIDDHEDYVPTQEGDRDTDI